MKPPEINEDILITELIDHYSFSTRFLMEKGIRCIMCGDSSEGTLREAVNEKGFSAQELEAFVKEMKQKAEQLKD